MWPLGKDRVRPSSCGWELAHSGCTGGHPALSHLRPVPQGCSAVLEHLRAQSASRSVGICGGPTVCWDWVGVSFFPPGGRERNPHGGDGGLARVRQWGRCLESRVPTAGASSDEEGSESKREDLSARLCFLRKPRTRPPAQPHQQFPRQALP